VGPLLPAGCSTGRTSPFKGARGLLNPPKVGGWGFAVLLWRAIFAPTLRLPTAPCGFSFGCLGRRSFFAHSRAGQGVSGGVIGGHACFCGVPMMQEGMS